jgi:uncharacterized membrane protein HdeD (DUF308 family)
MWDSLFGLLCLVVAILVIYDVFANQKKLSTGMKVLWTVLAVLFSVVTGIVYYFVVYHKK